MQENTALINKKILLYATNFLYAALIAIPFVASFSSGLVNVFIGFSVFAFLFKKIINKKIMVAHTIINLPFLCLILVSLISFINSVSIKASIGGIGKLLKYGFLFIIITEELKDIKHAKKIAIAIISGLYLASLDGVYQLFRGMDFFRGRPYDVAIGLPRLTSTFPHTNIFAVYLGLFLPVAIALMFYYLKGKKKFLLGLVSAVGACCLFLTFSRGAVLGFICAILLMAMLKKDKIIMILLVLALILGYFAIPENIHKWVKQTDSIWEVLLNKERINIYKTSVNMISHHPVIGVGVNTYCLNYQKYKIKETSGFTGDAKYYAHNIFLHMAGEIGLLGLAIFLWLLFFLFKNWFKFFKIVKLQFLQIFGLGIFAGIIAFLINGQTETNLYYSKVATLFWYQVGILLGLYRLNKSEEKSHG